MTFWSTTPNLFDNVTKRSMRKMLVLGKDHLSKLKAQQADAVINALYLRTEPLLTAFALRYTERSNAKAQYKGHTAKMSGLLKELRQLKVKQWDVQIQNHHLQGTAEYAALLPDRRRPFQAYGTDSRIASIEALSMSLGQFPALAAIQADVDSFHTLISQARHVQQQHEQRVAQSITDLEQARVALATIMYRNLGVLMDKYGDTPAMIGNFWEVRLLRQ